MALSPQIRTVSPLQPLVQQPPGQVPVSFAAQTPQGGLPPLGQTPGLNTLPIPEPGPVQPVPTPTPGGENLITVGNRQVPTPFDRLPRPQMTIDQIRALTASLSPERLFRPQRAVIQAQAEADRARAGTQISRNQLGPAAFLQFLRDQGSRTSAQLAQARASSQVQGSGSQINALLGLLGGEGALRGQDLQQSLTLLSNILAGTAGTA